MLLIASCMFIWDMIHIKTDCLYPPPPHSSLCCSLKLECEKLATEKTEIQRHYVMVSPFYTDIVECHHNKDPSLRCIYFFTAA